MPTSRKTSRSRPLNVSVSVSSRTQNLKVSVSSRQSMGRSRSRLGLKIKHLGLVSVSDPKVSFTCLPNMHKCRKFGEVQSSNFQDIMLTRPNRVFSGILEPVTLNFDLLIPNKSWCVCHKMHQCWKFYENNSNAFQDTVLTRLWTHRQDSWTARKRHTTFGGGIKMMHKCVSYT